MKKARRPDQPLLEFLAVLGIAFVLTCVAYGPGLRAEFVSDDINAIVENEWVSGPFDPLGIVGHLSWWGAGRSDSSGYRPAATLSFAVNRIVTGPSPYGFRLVNFACNALCAALLFALARMLALGRWTALAAAIVFAVLPIHSEAVLWIVGRAELAAAAAFLLIAILALAHRRSGAKWLPVAAAFTILVGMAFKENAVTAIALPAIFLVATGMRDAVRRRRDATMTLALAAGATACGLLRVAAVGPVRLAAPLSLLDNPLSAVGLDTRLFGSVAAFGRYIALTCWPASLSIDYSYDALGIGPGFVANADTAVAVGFLAIVALAAWRVRERRDVLLIGLLMAAASYSIVSNTVFLLGTILGERLFYLPTAGLVIALAAVVDPLLGRLASHRNRAIAAGALLAGLCVVAIFVDRGRAIQWRTPASLFESAVQAVPRSARAHMELGSAYGNAGRIDDAARHFATALAILPDYSAAAYNQGNTLARAGRLDDAAAAYRKALAIDPRFGRAWHNLALTERLRGNADGWIEALRRTVSLSPSPAMQSELAEALVTTGRYAEAVSEYDALIAAGNTSAASYFNRGVAHHHLGGCSAAVEDYRLATSAPGGSPREALAAAAGCLRQLGRSDEALAIEQRGKVANRDTRR